MKKLLWKSKTHRCNKELGSKHLPLPLRSGSEPGGKFNRSAGALGSGRRSAYHGSGTSNHLKRPTVIKAAAANPPPCKRIKSQATPTGELAASASWNLPTRDSHLAGLEGTVKVCWVSVTSGEPSELRQLSSTENNVSRREM